MLGVLNYPEVIELMNEDLNWTWQLGEAVANQQSDVMDAVQSFRAKAKAAGNLETNDKMVITAEEEEEKGQEQDFRRRDQPGRFGVRVGQESRQRGQGTPSRPKGESSPRR